MKTDEDRAKENRDYFELGCLCLKTGALKKLDKTTPHWQAVAHYEKECACSRNYPAGALC